MKNKVLMTVAVIFAAAFAGGTTAWVVSQSNKPQPHENHPASGATSGTVHSEGFAGAGSHFTSFTEDGYPDLTYAAENAVKAVVSVIKTEEIRRQSYGRSGFGNPFFEFFGVPEGYERNEDDSDGTRYREQQSGGSGVIVSPDGYIVTNHHVVNNASKLTVKLPGGKTYDARLVGTDADTEIALLKIEETGLPSIPFGSSDALRLGEWVLAIGNPYDLQSTVTAGIVSAKARRLGAIQTSGDMGIESFIQTDAAVNPGNSGGALVNTKGELVGINTLLVSRTGSYAGYSFAVPETIVRKVIADIREYGVVQRAIIGIMYTAIDDRFIQEEGKELGITETGGLYVGEVMEGGGAEAAGIKVGDIVTEIDGKPVFDASSVLGVVNSKRPGDIIKIIAKRDGKVKQFEVALRNRAGKSELLPKSTFDAVQSLGGEFETLDLSEKQKKELGIRGGIQVVSIGQDGILARAKVQRGYIITSVNGIVINSVNDLYRVKGKITSIEGVYPNGKSVTYSLVE